MAMNSIVSLISSQNPRDIGPSDRFNPTLFRDNPPDQFRRGHIKCRVVDINICGGALHTLKTRYFRRFSLFDWNTGTICQGQIKGG